MNIMLDKGAYIPEYAHSADAGADMRSPEQVIIPANGSATIDTGVHIEIPYGLYGKIESKSGLNVKHGVVSCGGVIDSGYTGSIKVKLYNLSNRPYTVNAGDKIAQIIFMPVFHYQFCIVDEFNETERGNNGFGSTGR